MDQGMCVERVGLGMVTYPCDLGLPPGHPGPCSAKENRASVAARSRWEDTERYRQSPLAEFQGFPQTTAERYTVNPTPVPQSESILRQDAAEAQAQKAAASFPVIPREVIDEVRRAEAEQNAEDGLAVLYRDEHIVLKWLPDGAYMLEHPDGVMGQRVEPGWIDVSGDDVVVPTKQRPGDQVLPLINGMRDAQSQMAEDILERRSVGISRYGTPLQPFNGRNTILDLYEELLDAAVYARTLLTMREATREMLIEETEKALSGTMLPRMSGYANEQYRREAAEEVVERLLDALVQRG